MVTNRDLAGDDLIRWYRQRCGKGEEVHGILKDDLAGGRLPSGRFGANAAWWAIVVLAFNLNSAMKQLALGGDWKRKRLKAVRLRYHLSTGTSGAARQETDHSSGAEDIHPWSCWSVHA